MANQNIVVQPATAAAAETWSNSKGVYFNATDKYFRGSPTGFGGSAAFSMAMTINLDMTASTGSKWMATIINAAALNFKFITTWFNSTFRFEVGDVSTSGIVSVSPTRADKTYHLVFVYDGSLSGNTNRCKIYVDGALPTVTDQGGTVPATLGSVVNYEDDDFFIGARADSKTTVNYPEKVKEVSLFGEALSAAQVTALYNGGSFSDPTLIASCENSWWFGDNSNDYEEVIYDNKGDKDLTGVRVVSGDMVTV